MACAPLVLALAAQAQGLDLPQLLQQLVPEADCAEEKVLGQCSCPGPLGLVPCGLRIARYVPVAFVETTRAPGDSLLDAMAADFVPVVPPVAATASSALSTTDNTAEVHVWALPGLPLPALACLGCSAASAAQPVHPPDRSAAACGPASVVARALDGFPQPGALLAPHLAYASEFDIRNWRTGCRDLADPHVRMGLPALCRGLAGPLARVAGAPAACLGAWGPLLPRQMRDIGPTPILYSAKTAVRAMSIARDQLGTFVYPVDTAGKLQQAYPALSACFRVGSLPLPALPLASRPALLSADGRYGWVYWRPTVCCEGFALSRQCLRTR